MARVSLVVHASGSPAHLSNCLTSLVQQSHANLDIVLVPDGTVEVASVVTDFATRDDRFRVLDEARADPGAARNLGAAAADGDYLAFVDGQDAVPPRAYELLVASLEASGSDFASGHVDVLTDSGSSPHPDLAEVCARNRTGTHVSRFPALLRDRPATNKLFRTQAWRSFGLQFAEAAGDESADIRFEDAEVTLPAHALARAVDVVAEPVYFARPRDDDQPVYEQIPGRVLRGRVHAVRTVSQFLAEHADARTKHRYDELVLSSDLLDVVCAVDRAEEDDQRDVVEAAREYLMSVPPRRVARLPAIDRLTYHLVNRQLLPELVEVVERRRLGKRGIPVVRRRGRFYAAYPHFDDDRLGIPRSLYRLDEELELAAQVDQMHWRDGRLIVEGYAYVPGVGAPSPRLPRMFALLRREGRRRLPRVVPLRVKRLRRPDVTADVYHPQENLDWSGFRLTVHPRGLLRHARRMARKQVHGEAAGPSWRVEPWLQVGATVRPGILRPSRNNGFALHLRAGISPGVRLVAVVHPSEGLRLRVEGLAAELSAHAVRDGCLVVRGVLHTRQQEGRLRLRRRRDGAVHEVPLATTEPGEFAASVPLHLLREGDGDVSAFWDLFLTWGDGKPIPLAAAAECAEAVYAAEASNDSHEVVVDRTREGTVRLRVRPPRPRLTEAAWVGADLRLSGTLPWADGSPEAGAGKAGRELVVRNRATGQEHRWRVTVSGLTFTATVTPFGVTSLAGVLPLPAGLWIVGMGRTGGDTTETLDVIEVADELRRRPPPATEVGHKQVTLNLTRDRPVLVALRNLEMTERGGYRQRLLKFETYPALQREPLSDVVLYSSFNGQQYSDSPRAIHEELVCRGVNLRHLWVVRDGQVALPPTAEPVREDSREYYEAFARARYVVVNDHLRQWFSRRDGQTVLQTWHGTPLKALGFDLAETRPATGRYLDGLYQQTRNWQYVLSPNPFTTEIFKTAYRLERTVLEVGYPRNDIFFRPDRERTAAAVRARLGIPPGKRVVLYAPTYRDHATDAAGRMRLDLRLDLDLLRRALGRDHVLLVRFHRYVVDPVPGAGNGFVVDTSSYPDMAELLLIADVLITDYSSVMFDFANTSRPMVFYTYDLEQYRDEVRGMYLDFPAEAPGPLLVTSEQVAEAVRAADAVRAEHEHRYAPFAERFCAADDGKAAARTVDRVFADALDMQPVISQP